MKCPADPEGLRAEPYRCGWGGIAVLALGASLVSPIPCVAETLASALTRTYETNPGIRAGVESVRAAAEAYPQARAGYLPTLTIQVQEQGYTTDQVTSYRQAGNQSRQLSTGTGSESLLLANLSQTLYDGGKTAATMQVAESQVAAALADLDGEVGQVFQSLVGEYINLLRLTALLELNADIMAQLKLLEVEAQSLFSKRLGTLTDVAQAQTAIAGNGAQRTTLTAALAASRSNYQALSGRPPDTPGDWPQLPVLPPTLDEAKRIAAERNPTLRASRFGVAGANAGIKVAKSGFLPNAQLNAQWYAERNPSQDDLTGYGTYRESLDTQGAALMAVLNIPVFAGGAVRSQVREAYANFNSSSYTMNEVYNHMIGSLESGWAQWQSAVEREQFGAVEVKAAHETLTGFTRQFHNGLSTMKDVIDARRSLDSAQAQQISVRADILTAHANLLGTMGRLTPQDLSLKVKPHGAEAYVQAVRRSILGPALP